MKPNVAALVEQMPDTDNDIKAKQEEAKAQAQPAAPDQPKPKPTPLGAASKFTGPDPDAAEKIFAEILSGGRESIRELLGLVREPSDADYKNYKATYVLHGLVIRAGRGGKESERRLLADTLASQLGSDKHSKAVKAVFIRELRPLGGKESVSALGKQLGDDELCGDATLALLTIRDDGIGFNPRVPGEHLNRRGGFGIFNIRERLAYFGGRMEFDSQPGRGTSITLIAPVENGAPAAGEAD